MTHSNDAQCRPVRLDQYVNQDPRLIFKTRLVFTARPLLGPSTTTLDPRPVFEARLVFKARLLFEEIRYSHTSKLASSIVWFLPNGGRDVAGKYNVSAENNGNRRMPRVWVYDYSVDHRPTVWLRLGSTRAPPVRSLLYTFTFTSQSNEDGRHVN